MLKNKKIAIVLAVALVCLIAATALLVAFLTPLRTTFYVFKDSYKAGTTITKDMLTPVQADSRIVIAANTSNAGLYYITNENLTANVKSGDVLRQDVQKGEAFMIAHIAAKGGNEVEVKMSPNAVAITVSVSNITGVTEDLKSESHVNVYVTYESGNTELALQNIRVLSVSKSDEELEGVTLELTKEQAIVVVNAINNGSLYLGLVNANGYIYDEVETN